MPSRKNVQNAHISAQLRELHGALLDIVSVMNQPQRDEALIREAGIRLDRALFPLLVGIERFGPIGVVDLADRAGRDYTTVSRQVAKLESLGLVKRQASLTDRRVREAVVGWSSGLAGISGTEILYESASGEACSDSTCVVIHAPMEPLSLFVRCRAR